MNTVYRFAYMVCYVAFLGLLGFMIWAMIKKAPQIDYGKIGVCLVAVVALGEYCKRRVR